MSKIIEINIKGFGVLELNTKDMDRFGIPLVYVIDDIKQFGTRRASFSKTIKVVGSKNNNDIFNQLYEIKGVNFSYKFGSRYDCTLLVNKIPIFSGFLQLNNITKHKINTSYEIIYEINIFEETKNLFSIIDSKNLVDLDFSSSFTYGSNNYAVGDHIMTDQLVGDSLNDSSSYEDVFVYPFIDYGFNLNGFFEGVSKGILYPSTYVKPIIDKIFQDAGYSYESVFFNTDLFKNLVLPYSKSTDFTHLKLAQYNRLTNLIGYDYQSPNDVNLYEDDITINGSASQFYTLGNQLKSYGAYTANGIEVKSEGEYQLNFKVDASLDRGGIDSFDGCQGVSTEYKIYVYNTADDTTRLVHTFYGNDMKSDPLTDTAYVFEYDGLELGELSVVDVITLRVKAGQTFVDDEFEHCAERTFEDIELNGISLELIYKRTDISEYDPTILLGSTLPDITQAELLRNLIKMFNLYIYSDRTNANNLIIEPFDLFYNQTNINWDKKVDYNKPQIIYNLNDSISNRNIFEYKKGEDFSSVRYFNQYNETIGTKKIILDNDLLKEESKVSLDFQSYADIGNANNGTGVVYYMGLYDDDTKKNGLYVSKKEYEPLIGLLDYGNINAKVAGYYNTIYNGETTRINTVNHNRQYVIDMDIHFDSSNEENLYNIYWNKYMNNLISPDARKVTLYVDLKIEDILNLNFREKVFIDGQLYILQDLQYDPSNDNSSKITLLKEILNIEGVIPPEGSFLLKNNTGDYITINGVDKFII
jgi:hypothetical protein